MRDFEKIENKRQKFSAEDLEESDHKKRLKKLVVKVKTELDEEEESPDVKNIPDTTPRKLRNTVRINYE